VPGTRFLNHVHGTVRLKAVRKATNSALGKELAMTISARAPGKIKEAAN
jgi:hypothetical protein